MKLNIKAIQELQDLMNRDYGISLSVDDAQAFGVSLLRLTKISIAALARADETDSSIQAREGYSLEAKTSE